MKILGIIPARFSSTRFPGKPLTDIKGKPMVMWVYEQALNAGKLDDVIVATDDQRIFDTVKKYKGKVLMTSGTHNSGTERCREVVAMMEKKKKFFDVVVNIQGDEPLINPDQINKVSAGFETEEADISTLAKKISSIEEIDNPNVVKVVADSAGNAIYFSRSPIPYVRGEDRNEWPKTHNFLKHVGIYAYRTHILREITLLAEGKLEKTEALEQLRWLENGYKIRIQLTEHDSFAIDTPEDLQNFINKI